MINTVSDNYIFLNTPKDTLISIDINNSVIVIDYTLIEIVIVMIDEDIKITPNTLDLIIFDVFDFNKDMFDD